MLRSLPLALLGAAFVCNASASAQTGPCAVTAADLNQIVLPVSGGAHVVKMRVGPVLTLGTNSVIALTSDGVLWLVRDAINAPVLVEIAEGSRTSPSRRRPRGWRTCSRSEWLD